MSKQVRPKKKKKKIRYLPINPHTEYEKVILILRRDTIKEVIKTINYPLS